MPAIESNDTALLHHARQLAMLACESYVSVGGSRCQTCAQTYEAHVLKSVMKILDRTDLQPCECGCGRLAAGGIMEAAHPEDAGMNERDKLDAIFADGQRACSGGQRLIDNPYGDRSETPGSTAWKRGWLGRNSAMIFDLSGGQAFKDAVKD